MNTSLDSSQKCRRCAHYQHCDGELRVLAHAELLQSVYHPTNAQLLIELSCELCEAYKPRGTPLPHTLLRCRACGHYTMVHLYGLPTHGTCLRHNRSAHHSYVACEDFKPKKTG